MIPFRVAWRTGVPLHEQIAFAARKAMVTGQLRPGDPFPSVRALSVDLKVNPNTAHKVVTGLIAEGLLEVLPGIGTVVAGMPPSSRADRTQLLGAEVEQLVVESLRLGLSLDQVQAAVADHWQRLRKDAKEDA